MRVLLATLFAAVTIVRPCLAQPVTQQSPGAVLPAGSRLYLTLDENVSSARGADDVGTVVRCRVWRDVESGGQLFIKSGTPAICRVDKVSHRNMGGFEGKVSVAGVETKSVDDQTIMLAGGYNKEGGGHKAVVLTVGLLLFWPALFIPGGNAELPPGTVFDVSTVNDLQLSGALAPVRVIDIRPSDQLDAQFMTDDFVAQKNHDTFRIKVSKPGELPPNLVIDSVNGNQITPIALEMTGQSQTDGRAVAVASVKAKVLSAHFSRGINRFDVSYGSGADRHATEVVMDVQM